MRKSSQAPSGKTKPASPPADAGPKKKPGVRTIAEATGLSVATVSRVLNGAANVSAATREQVLAAMQDFAYAPNSAARALATQRTRTIAAVVVRLSPPKNQAGKMLFASHEAVTVSRIGSPGVAVVTSAGEIAIEDPPMPRASRTSCTRCSACGVVASLWTATLTPSYAEAESA